MGVDAKLTFSDLPNFNLNSESYFKYSIFCIFILYRFTGMINNNPLFHIILLWRLGIGFYIMQQPPFSAYFAPHNFLPLLSCKNSLLQFVWFMCGYCKTSYKYFYVCLVDHCIFHYDQDTFGPGGTIICVAFNYANEQYP